jgi:hypothetical protein
MRICNLIVLLSMPEAARKARLRSCLFQTFF